MNSYEPEVKGEAIGDWSDTGIRSTTDRTGSMIEMVNRVEWLTNQLKVAIVALKKIADTGDKTYAVVALDIIENEREL